MVHETYPDNKKKAPCAKLITRIKPKISVNPLATRKYNPARVIPLRKVKMNRVIDTPPSGYSALYLHLYTSGDAGGKSMGFATNLQCYSFVT